MMARVERYIKEEVKERFIDGLRPKHKKPVFKKKKKTPKKQRIKAPRKRKPQAKQKRQRKNNRRSLMTKKPMISHRLFYIRD